ncbi:MAG: hypothetical protein H6600_01260 [Flavobacteriales bacterium]|nr:hypothetical protein [Flavobacteriales bacterium]
MKKIQLSLLILGLGITLMSSCKKEEPELRDEKVGGCLDKDSPLYNANADFDDESCVYAYINAYQVTFHPQKDESGSDWDFLVNTDADLLLRFKVDGGTSWLFESAVIDNQPHDQAANWTAPVNIKLYNQDYYWEVYDYDGTSGDDFVASGTFNPLELADKTAMTVTVIGNSNTFSNGTQLVLTFELDE